jgi:hypothetical protein
MFLPMPLYSIADIIVTIAKSKSSSDSEGYKILKKLLKLNKLN